MCRCVHICAPTWEASGTHQAVCVTVHCMLGLGAQTCDVLSCSQWLDAQQGLMPRVARARFPPPSGHTAPRPVHCGVHVCAHTGASAGHQAVLASPLTLCGDVRSRVEHSVEETSGIYPEALPRAWHKQAWPVAVE